MTEAPPTDEEFERAINSLCGAYLIALQTNGGQAAAFARADVDPRAHLARAGIGDGKAQAQGPAFSTRCGCALKGLEDFHRLGSLDPGALVPYLNPNGVTGARPSGRS